MAVKYDWTKCSQWSPVTRFRILNQYGLSYGSLIFQGNTRAKDKSGAMPNHRVSFVFNYEGIQNIKMACSNASKHPLVEWMCNFVICYRWRNWVRGPEQCQILSSRLVLFFQDHGNGKNSELKVGGGQTKFCVKNCILDSSTVYVNFFFCKHREIMVELKLYF